MTSASIAFGGGMALAAYHGGVCEAAQSASVEFAAIAGSSAGALTSAVLAGSPEDERIGRLKKLWHYVEHLQLTRRLSSLPGWMSAVEGRVFGRRGQFHVRNPLENVSVFKSVYDLGPLRGQLRELIDFDRLNGGQCRVCIVATDVQSGEAVVFDTSKCHRIEIDHLMASCGFLPEFAPVELAGRLLCDGGLSLNVPFEPLLEGEGADLLFVSDLFARDGERPQSLAAAVERKNDLLFANQTILRLRAAMAAPQQAARQVYLLSYRNEGAEAGAEKTYDYSATATAQRWRAGRLDMTEAISQHSESAGKAGLTVVRRCKQPARAFC